MTSAQLKDRYREVQADLDRHRQEPGACPLVPVLEHELEMLEVDLLVGPTRISPEEFLLLRSEK